MTKVIQIILIILVGAGLINFVRSGKTFPLAGSLPFCDGMPINIQYAVAGVVMLCILVWGIGRLNRKDDED